MEVDSHKLIFKIDSPGEVSVDTLSKKLQAAQQVLFNIGSAIAGGGRRGPYAAEVLQSCTLYFVESRSDSPLEVITHLPKEPVLFREMDLGERSLRSMNETLGALEKRDQAKIQELYPDSGQRSRVLKSLVRLLPEEDAEYELLVTSLGVANTLRPNLRETWERAITEPTELPDLVARTLTGTLYLIEVVTGKHQVGIIVRNRNIPCYYSPEDEPVIRDLIPGSLVEVKGRVTLNDMGDVQQVEEIIDITMVQPIVPLTWTRIDYGNSRFLLTEQIQIQQDFRNGVWVCEFEPLGILGYGSSRHEAVVSFRRDFAACWHDIAEEEDDKLTLDAQELKEKFRNLVKDVARLE